MQEVYSYEQVHENALVYFSGDDLAATVWTNKYALRKNKTEWIELTPDDMHWRLAKELARIENIYLEPMSEQEIFNLIEHFKYIIPQGGSMSGIGNNYQIMSLSNCFVVGNKYDSYGSILQIDQEIVQLMKRRAGVGADLSYLRSKGMPTQNAAITSSGAADFAPRYSNSTREVAQDGRRGALMLTMHIKHPDAERFIDLKMKKGQVTGANISVKLNDEFMKAVENDEEFIQQFPINSDSPKIIQTIKARKLWDKIIYNAWASAEPGVLFWDQILRESPADCYADEGFTTTSTNPCGEIPLCPYDSCRLLAINLYSYVVNPFTENAYFNFELFKDHVGKAQKLMDDIVDLELEQIDKIINKIKKDPEPFSIKSPEIKIWENIREKAKQGRRTGLGVTAEGDMLAALNLRYGSKEGNDFCVKVHKTLAVYSYKSSIDMARQRGAFPIWNLEKEEDNPFIRRIMNELMSLTHGGNDGDYGPVIDYQDFGRRNISCLTIAPTGTTSLMAQTTSGIEPLFLPLYERRRKVNPSDSEVKVNYVDEEGDSWEKYTVFHSKFIEWYKINHFSKTDENYQKEHNILEILQSFRPSILQKLVEKSPYYKATIDDIDWVSKIELQGRVQKWIDHSISVTVNIPKEITKKKVEEIYLSAWKFGCKGCTIYREGSRDGILLRKEEFSNDGDNHAKERPRVLDAQMLFFQNNKEKWVAFIGILDNRPYEIFTGKVDERIALIPKSPNIAGGKIIKERVKGESRYDFHGVDYSYRPITLEGISKCFDPEYWNYAKLISGILRQRMNLIKVIDLIEGLNFKEENINAWKVGVVRGLKQFIIEGTEVKKKCPECENNTLIYQEGCLICKNCGYGKC